VACIKVSSSYVGRAFLFDEQLSISLTRTTMWKIDPFLYLTESLTIYAQNSLLSDEIAR
jgi:hypothetical protein